MARPDDWKDKQKADELRKDAKKKHDKAQEALGNPNLRAAGRETAILLAWEHKRIIGKIPPGERSPTDEANAKELMEEARDFALPDTLPQEQRYKYIDEIYARALFAVVKAEDSEDTSLALKLWRDAYKKAVPYRDIIDICDGKIERDKLEELKRDAMLLVGRLIAGKAKNRRRIDTMWQAGVNNARQAALEAREATLVSIYADSYDQVFIQNAVNEAARYYNLASEWYYQVQVDEESDEWDELTAEEKELIKIAETAQIFGDYLLNLAKCMDHLGHARHELAAWRTSADGNKTLKELGKAYEATEDFIYFERALQSKNDRALFAWLSSDAMSQDAKKASLERDKLDVLSKIEDACLTMERHMAETKAAKETMDSAPDKVKMGLEAAWNEASAALWDSTSDLFRLEKSLSDAQRAIPAAKNRLEKAREDAKWFLLEKNLKADETDAQAKYMLEQLDLELNAHDARRKAVVALRTAEEKTVHREVEKRCFWDEAKEAAKTYLNAAIAWADEPRKRLDVDIATAKGRAETAANRLGIQGDAWKEAIASEGMAAQKTAWRDPGYYRPVREEEYARGFLEKVKQLSELDDDGTKTKRRIHLIHSAKGGCGKTYTAITYAMYLAWKNAYGDTSAPAPDLAGFREDALKHKQNRVLLVDCDFRGAGVETQLLNTFYKPTRKDYCKAHRDELGSTSDHKRPFQKNGEPAVDSMYKEERTVENGWLLCVDRAPQYFNRCMIQNEEPFPDACISKMRMYRKLKLTGDGNRDVDRAIARAHPSINNEVKVGFDVMFSDSGADAKRAFLASDGSTVQIAYFKRCFEAMLADLLEKHAEYTDIIIDMSPGTDEYVDNIKAVCLSGAFAKDNRVYLHAVTTSDVAHIRAMEEYLESDIAHRPLRQHNYREIRLVVNEIRRYYWDRNYGERNAQGEMLKSGDPGGLKGTANAEAVAADIIKRMNVKVANPNNWLEVYSQLFCEEFQFDALSMDSGWRHPLTETFLAMLPRVAPYHELEKTSERSPHFNRRFDLPLLFWPLGSDIMLDPNTPLESNV